LFDGVVVGDEQWGDLRAGMRVVSSCPIAGLARR